MWNDLSPEARAVIDRQGVVYVDEEGDLVTSIVNGKDCVFTCYDESGCCYCALEKAYREGRISFYKPISCHLYPIRIGDYGPYKAVNYHRWDVCRAPWSWDGRKASRCTASCASPSSASSVRTGTTNLRRQPWSWRSRGIWTIDKR